MTPQAPLDVQDMTPWPERRVTRLRKLLKQVRIPTGVAENPENGLTGTDLLEIGLHKCIVPVGKPDSKGHTGFIQPRSWPAAQVLLPFIPRTEETRKRLHKAWSGLPDLETVSEQSDVFRSSFQVPVLRPLARFHFLAHKDSRIRIEGGENYPLWLIGKHYRVVVAPFIPQEEDDS